MTLALSTEGPRSVVGDPTYDLSADSRARAFAGARREISKMKRWARRNARLPLRSGSNIHLSENFNACEPLNEPAVPVVHAHAIETQGQSLPRAVENVEHEKRNERYVKVPRAMRIGIEL